jgi:hypothetical protein
MKRPHTILVQTALAALLVAGGCATSAVPAPSAVTAVEPASAAVTAEMIDEAFLYGYGIYEFARFATSGSTSVGRKVNVIGHRRVLSDHTHRNVTAPNMDTLYSSAILELSGGPVEVITPEAPDRYHSIAFMDMFTDNFEILGTRNGGGHEARYWVVGPGWQGEAPEGVSLIRSLTNDVWMLGRTLVRGSHDLEAALSVQSQIRVEKVAGRGEDRPFGFTAPPVADPETFLMTVNAMLGRTDLSDGQGARAAAFAAVGIRPGDMEAWAKLDPEVRAIWTERFAGNLQQLRENAEAMMVTRNGWRAAPPGVGDFGDNDRLRASVALWGLAALSSDEATYFRTSKDEGGATLDGSKAYRFTIPAEGVPVDAFWSLTMYAEQPDGRFFLVDNPIGRYSVSDRVPGVTPGPDGSYTFYLQNKAPAGAAAANWLPTPDGPFMVSFRAYLPRPELFETEWTPPPLVPSTPE